MTPSTQPTPREALELYLQQHAHVKSYCVAYSGGADSHVLLALMAALRNEQGGFDLRAVHVDHGLQAESVEWAAHAQQVCAELNVRLDIRTSVVQQTDKGPEAAARRARYMEFVEVLQFEEHLLLAQHADDQAETFLLQALRGSGPDGLSGIPARRAFGQGVMSRPLLSCSQSALQTCAEAMDLNWIEDPSNSQLNYDRNYLRHMVMPLLEARWPAATRTLSRSASRSAAASRALMSMAQQDLDSVKVAGKPELKLSALQRLPQERAFTAIRLWVRQRDLPMPRLQDLKQVHTDLIEARYDSNGIVNVREYEFRRHKDSLYLLLPQSEQKPFRYIWNAPFDDLFIAETGTTMTRGECFRQGIRLPETGHVSVKSRAGGELIRVGEPAFHKAVKKILQESSIPPWQREAIPLVYIDDSLAAVWQLAVATKYQGRMSVGSVASNPMDSQDGDLLNSADRQDGDKLSAANRQGDDTLNPSEAELDQSLSNPPMDKRAPV